MNQSERKEATRVLNTVLDTIVAVKKTDRDMAAELVFSVGQLRVNAERLINNGVIAQPLAEVFATAREAGVSFDGMDFVRNAAQVIGTVGFPATSVKNVSVRLALVQIGYILAATEFSSRQQIDRYIERINGAFDTAETAAGDGLDNAVYRALISLHGAITNDLNTRALPLPRVIIFRAPSVLPMLWVANRLYGDATREAELRAENNPVHPAFVQPDIRALSQ